MIGADRHLERAGSSWAIAPSTRSPPFDALSGGIGVW